MKPKFLINPLPFVIHALFLLILEETQCTISINPWNNNNISLSTWSNINIVFQCFSFFQILQDNGNTKDECFKLHLSLERTPFSNLNFKPKFDSFNNNYIATCFVNTIYLKYSFTLCYKFITIHTWTIPSNSSPVEIKSFIIEWISNV